jgi:hypothetical protein
MTAAQPIPTIYKSNEVYSCKEMPFGGLNTSTYGLGELNPNVSFWMKRIRCSNVDKSVKISMNKENCNNQNQGSHFSRQIPLRIDS